MDRYYQRMVEEAVIARIKNNIGFFEDLYLKTKKFGRPRGISYKQLERLYKHAPPEFFIKFYDMGNRDDNLITLALELYNLELIKKFITEYPDFKYKHIAGDHENKFTPFTYACYMGRVDVVDYFLSTGIDVNFSDDLADPAILVSVGSVDVLTRLLECGANPNIFSLANGNTALHEAAKNRECLPIIIDHLMAHGADPRILNKNNKPPIFLCAGKYGLEKKKLLYDYAPDILLDLEQ